MFRSFWLRPLAHRWLGSRARKASSTRRDTLSRRGVRPRLEALEDRITPATFAPTTFADDGTANSLRGAITQANNDNGTATDTIQLQAGTYQLTIDNTAGRHDALSNTRGDLNIVNSKHAVVIHGVTDASGKPATFINQTVADRVFEIVPADATVTFKDLVIEGGRAQDDGGEGTVAGTSMADGGGILDQGANLTLINVVLHGNSADAGAGSVAEGGGIFTANPNGSLTIQSSVLQANSAFGGASTTLLGGAASGGGIYTVSQTTITQSTVSDNVVTGGNTTASAGFGGNACGGGIYANNRMTTISGSILSGNMLTGGSDVNGGGGFVGGGGIYANGPATITDSTLSGNTLTGGNGGNGTGGNATGGGAYFASGNNQIINVTVADNQAAGGKSAASPSAYSLGGGLYFDGTATATLTNVTVADNKAGLPPDGIGSTIGGGIYNGGTVTLLNTLVARNSADASPDFNGKVSGSSHNLIGNADGSSGFSAVNGDLLGSSAHPLDPRLGTLANNGGLTQTFALLPGSPAINAGNGIAEAATGPFDQRGQGFSRVAGGNIDIGAFEVQSPPSSGGGGQSASPPSQFQAWIALYLDGIELELFDQANLAGFHGDFATASALGEVLQFFGNPNLDAIQSSIAFNEQYAGPFGPFLVLAGQAAVLQAIQPS